MSLVELLGFLAMLFLMISSFSQKKRKGAAENIEDDEDDEQAQRLKEFLHGVKDDMQKSKQAAIQPKQAKAPIKTPKKTAAPVAAKIKYERKEAALNAPREEHYYSKNDEKVKDAYAIQKKTQRSRALNLIRSLKTPQDMILLHEILGPPTAVKALYEPFRNFPR